MLPSPPKVRLAASLQSLETGGALVWVSSLKPRNRRFVDLTRPRPVNPPQFLSVCFERVP